MQGWTVWVWSLIGELRSRILLSILSSLSPAHQINKWKGHNDILELKLSLESKSGGCSLLWCYSHSSTWASPPPSPGLLSYPLDWNGNRWLFPGKRQSHEQRVNHWYFPIGVLGNCMWQMHSHPSLTNNDFRRSITRFFGIYFWKIEVPQT